MLSEVAWWHENDKDSGFVAKLGRRALVSIADTTDK